MTASRLPLLAALAVVVAGALAVGALGVVYEVPPVSGLSLLDYVALAAAAALGDRLELPRRHGRATTMSIAVVASVALLTNDPYAVVAMAVGAWSAQALRSLVDGTRNVRAGSLVTGAVTAWGIGGLVTLATHLDRTGPNVGESDVLVLPAVVLWAVLLFGAPALDALEVAARADRTRRLRYRDVVAGGFQANMVLAATATLGALAYPFLGAPTVLLMALPLLAAKLGFDRNAETRTTYDQTLRAMSRLPEQLGAVDPGHGVRAGEVAAGAAVDLGFPADVVTDIERAAQLHELGRIRTEHGLDLSPEEVAAGGAGILTEAEDLDLRLTARGERVLQPADQSWIRSQGVQPRIAEAVIRSAQAFYASAAPTP